MQFSPAKCSGKPTRQQAPSSHETGITPKCDGRRNRTSPAPQQEKPLSDPKKALAPHRFLLFKHIRNTDTNLYVKRLLEKSGVQTILFPNGSTRDWKNRYPEMHRYAKRGSAPQNHKKRGPELAFQTSFYLFPQKRSILFLFLMMTLALTTIRTLATDRTLYKVSRLLHQHTA